MQDTRFSSNDPWQRYPGNYPGIETTCQLQTVDGLAVEPDLATVVDGQDQHPGFRSRLIVLSANQREVNVPGDDGCRDHESDHDGQNCIDQGVR